MVSRAFDDLHAASQPLLDDLALAERAQGRSAAESRARRNTNSGVQAVSAAPAGQNRCPNVRRVGGETRGAPAVLDAFCVADSPYYAEVADPPATAMFRRGLAVLGDYTRVLLVLAEGRNVEEARAQIQSIASNVGIALEVAGLTGAGAGLQGALAALGPLIDQAARDSDRIALERLVRAEAPKVENLLVALRDAAPEMFKTVTESSFARFNGKEALDSQVVARQEAVRIESYRVAISSYVMLLEQYRVLFHELVQTYDQKSNPVTLAGLAERSADLSARADAWRRTLAALRTGLQ